MIHRPQFRPLAVLALVALATGCATMKKMVGAGPPSVKLVAEESINVRADGSALGALHVRAYLLKDPASFRALSYEDLWTQRKMDKDGAVLDVQEGVLTAGGDQKLSFDAKKVEGAMAIAILAGYAQPEGDSGWRQVVDLSSKKNSVEITLGPRGMRPAALK